MSSYISSTSKAGLEVPGHGVDFIVEMVEGGFTESLLPIAEILKEIMKFITTSNALIVKYL